MSPVEEFWIIIVAYLGTIAITAIAFRVKAPEPFNSILNIILILCLVVGACSALAAGFKAF